MKITVGSLQCCKRWCDKTFSKNFNFNRHESVCSSPSSKSTLCYLCKKEYSKLSNCEDIQIYSNQKLKPVKKRNLYIKEKAKMFSSMAFDQDLNRLYADNISSITENQLPTDG